MDLILLALPVALLLAWVNGANDNIKGAATLVGSGLAGARTAIVLASAATVGPATRRGLPVSTARVNFGVRCGIATANRSGRLRTIAAIALAWGLTMPLGAVLGVVFHFAFNGATT